MERNLNDDSVSNVIDFFLQENRAKIEGLNAVKITNDFIKKHEIPFKNNNSDEVYIICIPGSEKSNIINSNFISEPCEENVRNDPTSTKSSSTKSTSPKSSSTSSTKLHQSSTERSSSRETLKETVVNASLSLLDTQFDPSIDLHYFYLSSLYSLFLICDIQNETSQDKSSKYNARYNIHVRGVLMFHYSPIVGTLVPLLVVNEMFRKQKVGTSLLMLLQRQHVSLFGNHRLLVWYSLVRGDYHEGLFLFYRKLGFYPIPPGNYPLRYIIGDNLHRSLIDVHEQVQKNNSQETTNDDESSDKVYNFLLGVHSIIDYEAQSTSTVYQVSNEESLINDDLKCQVCGVERKHDDLNKKAKLATDDIFVCCRHELKNSNVSMQYDNNKVASKVVSISTSKTNDICGIVMCFSCQNVFGHDSIKFCPIHTVLYPKESEASETDEAAKKRKKIKKNLISRTIQLNSKMIKTDELRKVYFGSAIEGLQGFQSDKEETKCRHCLVEHHAYGKNRKDKNIPVFDAFCRYKCIHSCNTEMWSTAIVDVKDSKYLLQMKTPCDYNSSFKSSSNSDVKTNAETTCNHPLFFDGNSGVTSSCLQNKYFGLKNIDGFGDCGYLGIMFSIMSAERQVYNRIYENLVKYRNNQYKTNPLLQPVSQKNIDVKELNIELLREVLFLSKIDMNHFRQLNLEEELISLFWFTEMQTLVSNINNQKNVEKLEYLMTYIAGCREYLLDDTMPMPELPQVQLKQFLPTLITAARRYSGKSLEMTWLSDIDICSIPYLTNGDVGVLIVSENYGQNNNYSPVNISDGGYGKKYSKHLLKDCSYFIILKLVKDKHFDLFYDRTTHRSIYPTAKIKESLGADAEQLLNPYKYICSLLPPDAYENLMGSPKTEPSTIDHKYNTLFSIPSNVINPIKPNPDFEVCRPMLDTWFQKIQDENDIDNGNTNMLIQINSITPWTSDSEAFCEENKQTDTSTHAFIFSELSLLDAGKYVPIVINAMELDFATKEDLIQSHHGCFLVCGYLHKVHENNSSSSPDSNTQNNFYFEICDCNKTPYDKTYKNKFLTNLFDNGRVHNKLHIDAISKAFKNGANSQFYIPTLEEVAHVKRNIVFNILKQQVCQTGVFSNDVFRSLGIFPTLLSDEVFTNLKNRSRHLSILSEDNEHKLKFYQLFIMFQKKDRQLYQHLVVFGESNLYYLINKKYADAIKSSFIGLTSKKELRTIIFKDFVSVHKDKNEEKSLLGDIAGVFYEDFYKANFNHMNYYFEYIKTEYESEAASSSGTITTGDHSKDASNSYVPSIDASVLSSTSIQKTEFTRRLTSRHVTRFVSNQRNSEISRKQDDKCGDNAKSNVFSYWLQYVLWLRNVDFYGDRNRKISKWSNDKRKSVISKMLQYCFHSLKKDDIFGSVIRNLETKYKVSLGKQNPRTFLHEELNRIIEAVSIHVGYQHYDKKSPNGVYLYPIEDDVIEEFSASIENNMDDQSVRSIVSESEASMTSETYEKKKDDFLMKDFKNNFMKNAHINKRTIAFARKAIKNLVNFSSVSIKVIPSSESELGAARYVTQFRCKKRIQNSSFIWNETPVHDDTCFKIDRVKINYIDVQDSILSSNKKNLSKNVFDAALSIFQEEYFIQHNDKREDGGLCVCFPFKFYDLLNGDNTTNYKGFKLIVHTLKEHSLSFLPFYDTFAVILVPMNLEEKDHFVLGYINTTNKVMLILDPVTNSSIDNTDKAFVTLRKILCAIYMFGSNEHKLNIEEVKESISSYKIEMPEKDYFGTCDLFDSSMTVLMNVYECMMRPPIENDFSFMSGKKCRNSFRQWLCSVFSQYHDCYSKYNVASKKSWLQEVECTEKVWFKLKNQIDLDTSKIQLPNTLVRTSTSSSVSSLSSAGSSLTRKNTDNIPEEKESTKVDANNTKTNPSEVSIPGNKTNIPEEKTPSADPDANVPETSEGQKSSMNNVENRSDDNQEKSTTSRGSSRELKFTDGKEKGSSTNNTAKTSEHILPSESKEASTVSSTVKAYNKSVEDANNDLTDTDSDTTALNDEQVVENNTLSNSIASRRNSNTRSSKMTTRSANLRSKRPKSMQGRSAHVPSEVQNYNLGTVKISEAVKNMFIDLKEDVFSAPTNEQEQENQEVYDRVTKSQISVSTILRDLNVRKKCKYISYIHRDPTNGATILKEFVIAEQNTSSFCASAKKSKKIFVLDNEGIEIIRGKNENELDDFVDQLKKAKNHGKWFEMPTNFQNENKKYSNLLSNAVAFHYQDFHTITYQDNDGTPRLFGKCYLDGIKTYESELKLEYVQRIEKYHRAYVIAKANAGQEIPLTIGKMNLL